MLLSEALRKWKANLTTRTPVEYVLTLRADINTFSDAAQALERENDELRELVDAWMGCGTRYHTMQGACPMFDADEEYFCKAARLAQELGIEVG